MNQPKIMLLLAFAAVYLIWGSTYLGIRYAIETLPPLLMAGTRFAVAGALLLAWAKWRGAAWPRLVEWRTAGILGVLLLLFGNGGVTLAEQSITSGLAALLVTVEPLFLVLLGWARLGGRAPNRWDVAGLALGFAGVAWLIAPWQQEGGSNLTGVGLVLVAAFTWAVGSLYATNAPQPSSKPLSNGMTMLSGGLLLLLAGCLRGEVAHLHWQAFSATSLLALAYLTVFGSLIAFTAYTYLLSRTTPALAATYAFVNPVVAVLLGWLIAGEPLGLRGVIAMIAIVGGVVLLTIGQRQVQPKSRQPENEGSLVECGELV